MLRVTALLLVLALVAAACSGSTSTSASTSPATSVTAPTTTTATTATPGTAIITEGGVDPEIAEALREQVAELAEIAEEIRGLTFFDDPNVVFMTSDELAARVLEDFHAELLPGEVEWTEAWLELLGLLDPSQQPLLELYTDLLSEQVVGLYVPETKELLVRGDAEALSVLSRTTVIHELLHALTDQHFDIGARIDALVDDQRFDEAGAYISLLEGEATYFQFIYIGDYLSTEDAVAIATEALATDSGALDETPYAIAESLFFRYEDGLDFAIALAEQGIEAFNDAHRDPPVSTEQIAHPERFAEAQAPIDVVLP